MKNNNKLKKKVKKGKKSSKDEWAFDGVSAETLEDERKRGIRGPRKTQEKDERLRRSRLKHEDKRIKSQFISKMKSKVRFSDVLVPPSSVGAGNFTFHGGNEKVTAVKHEKVIRDNTRNPLPLLDRFLNVMNRHNGYASMESFHDNHDSITDTSQDESEENMSINDDDLYEQEELNKIDDHMDDSINSSAPTVEEEEKELSSNEEEESLDENINQTSTSETFLQFFESRDIVQQQIKSPPMKMVSKLYDSTYLFCSSNLPFTLPNKIHTIQDLPNLHKMWRSRVQNLSRVESQILPYITSYMDALIETGAPAQKQIVDEYLHMSLCHACVHTVKARSIVLKHNQRLRKKAAESNANEAETKKRTKKSQAALKAEQASPVVSTLDTVIDDHESSAIEDQGYCRARTLILCPFRSSALTCVEMMKNIYGSNTAFANYDKFVEEYSYVADFESDEAEKKYENSANRQPDDWKDIFYRQNTDDDFKLGIQINVGQGKGHGSEKGVYMRLFSDFMISDIIIASPLGLRLAIEKSSKEDENSCDFLSSLEIVIVYQADIIYMQNWDHLVYVFQHMNQIPKNLSSTIDFSRIRKYFLENGQPPYHRQLIVLSSFIEPEIQSLYRQYAQSKHYRIRVKINRDDDVGEPISLLIIHPMISQQLFLRMNSISSMTANTTNGLESLDDQRFQFFQRKY